MKVINARLRKKEGLYTVTCDNDVIKSIELQTGISVDSDTDTIDAKENLLMAPFIDPHIHLDAVLTAGEPEWNMTGTLFEGIERWAQRKATVTHDDIKQRAKKTVDMLVAHGIQHVRTHVDITDPNLVGLHAMLEVKEEIKEAVNLQIVAFPQEGIESFKNGRELLEEALRIGADVVGGIPHFEYTRDKGVSSVYYLMDLAEKYNVLVDVHCDETDDPNSRFLEVLADEALVRGIGTRVTASHTTAMGSYDNAYCFKLFRLLKRSKINFISCPTESIHLQGRYDTYPKRRGITRVPEIDRAGMNICFAQDSIRDPWYPVGNGNILRILDAGLHICHMLGYEDLQRCLDFISDNSAKTMALDEEYGIEVNRPASFILFNVKDDYEVLTNQAKPILSVKNGKKIMERFEEKVEAKVFG
ncbi:MULTISPECIES: cytosine deaminase [Pseudomonadota]|jgi:cytosine deaminase|uniref:Cytosine deaminase n=1 Tax=Faucicola osloensis TaxID=34062 RepID=A0A2I1RF52_FAUOS|nr:MULTISPECIES: cytosine deaminase [Pseudomonadota]NPA79219.1 cytosine deaminase [Gammaproteobacteria bacterium]HCW34951.1 cytosine deaminase [Staphylococcus sp.]MBW4016753.1 cytosine deaminase [Moraxella osloensis]PKZ67751.1 cytosine deaminase [Moraxella osloensis]VXB15074.1 cytosine deaminase [Enhydrobacter sp. 8BJ]